jgi:hypothetical protein
MPSSIQDVRERQFFAELFEQSFHAEIKPGERVEALKVMLKMKVEWEMGNE